MCGGGGCGGGGDDGGGDIFGGGDGYSEYHATGGAGSTGVGDSSVGALGYSADGSTGATGSGGTDALSTFGSTSINDGLSTGTSGITSGTGSVGGIDAGIDASSGGLTTLATSNNFDNLPGLGNPNFGYLNTPGVQSVGGGDALTALQNGGASPGIPGASNISQGTGDAVGGTNVLSAPSSGATAAGVLPGVSSSGDLSANNQNKTNNSSGSGSSSSNSNDVLSSLGIKNPLGTAIGAGGLAYSLAQGSNPIASQAAQVAPQQLAQVQSYLNTVQSSVGPQTADAAAKSQQLYTQGQNLVQYLQTGTLPQSVQAQLDQATASAKTAIISNFAKQGMNTDPNENSVLAQQLAQVDQQALISKGQLEQQFQTSGMDLVNAANSFEQTSNSLQQTGLNAAGLSSDLYKTLVGIDQTNQAQIGAAIANFSKALSGGPSVIQIGGSK